MSAHGIVEAKIWRSEQLEYGERTSDPAAPAVGDDWIRSDIQPNNNSVAALRIQGSGGVLEVPIFDDSVDGSLGSDVYVGRQHVFDDGSVGYLLVTDQGGAKGSPRLVTSSGRVFEAHDAVELSGIPDSAIAQYPATDYDDNNDEWVDAVNSFNLTGGSAAKTTDSDGNTAVEYSKSSGQGHSNTSLSLPYNRGVVAVVINDNNTSNDGMLWGDPTDGAVYSRLRDTTSYGLKMGTSFISGGTPDGNIHLLLFFAPEFGSSDEQIELDGASVVSAEAGSKFLSNGFLLGEFANGFPLDGRVLEVVLYDNPTQTEISSERDRLKNKYSGLSF